jgi:hypothetical protein
MKIKKRIYEAGAGVNYQFCADGWVSVPNKDAPLIFY